MNPVKIAFITDNQTTYHHSYAMQITPNKNYYWCGTWISTHSIHYNQNNHYVCIKNAIPLTPGTQILKKSVRHITILGTRKVT